MKEKENNTKNIKIYLGHAIRLSKFKLVRQAKLLTDDRKLRKSMVQERKELEELKKTFYSLFEKDKAEYLIGLEKEINEFYEKFCEKTSYRLIDRTNLSRKTEEGIPREEVSFHRPEDRFRDVRKSANGDTYIYGEAYIYTDKTYEHISSVVMSRDLIFLDTLGSRLYTQEQAIKCAIQTSLKDDNWMPMAVEMAKYLDYITPDQYDEFKEKVLNKKRS